MRGVVWVHVIYTAVQLCVVGSTFKIIHDSRVGLVCMAMRSAAHR